MSIASTVTIDDLFEAFHRDNPQVYTAFKRFVLEARKAGVSRLSADMLLHRVRWDSMIATGGSGGYKVNNNFSSRYVRKFCEDFPHLAYLFEKRQLRSA
jgi:hypothetical protein